MNTILLILLAGIIAYSVLRLGNNKELRSLLKNKPDRSLGVLKRRYLHSEAPAGYYHLAVQSWEHGEERHF
ncbi:hypothetical protein SAMN02745216_02846 [Desulfatibacillum alkenivorans DSM 16219]|jgi:hypothetical protein|uniref:Uncharacterized protein n=1 Tax=Desulfatibacillum alkenivorans DSM 16219 TaxID=1121393 RepID=A0A1M6PII3_9BACT|nr:hypothetical protein [Desulfatibacillum alkenivorans]SHK07755.1 hypothetical protein SAMN02745216_02846 [Desulfatibacillum alkenivorans DSM 16219]